MKNHAPSNRQLKVGEVIRHVLSSMFLRGEIPHLDSVSITVSEVRISPDLRNATAYIYPLAGAKSDKIMPILAEYSGFIRHYVDQNINLRCSPRISFKFDNSFEYAARINDLLRDVQPSYEATA